MSNYGNPPSDPYGQNPQDPASNPYGQQGQYGGQPAGAYGGVPAGVVFSSWGKRAGAAIIDGLIMMVALIPYYIGIGLSAGSAEVNPNTGQLETTGGSGAGLALMAIGGLATLAVLIWNVFLKQGKTGYTVGKGVLGIKLVKADTGQPIGAGMAFARYLITSVISFVTCGIGALVDHLWPLWDDKNQTLHDKIIKTYVIDQPKG